MRMWRRLAADRSRAADALLAVVVYLVTRLGLTVFAWLCGQHYSCTGPRCTWHQLFVGNFVLDGLYQWDGYHYVQLATRGYFEGNGFDTTVPFFPGFPVLAVLAGKLLGSPLLGGIVVNHICSIAAAFLMARVVCRLQLRDPAGEVSATAREAVLFWLASPLTLFFCAFLSESVFGLASVAVIWAVLAGRWPVALLFGMLATATRNAGLIVVAAAIVLAWERRREVRPGTIGWLCLLAMPLGLGAFILYQQHVLGDGFAWVATQRRWNRFLVFPWRTFHDDWLGLPSVRQRGQVDQMYRTQEVLAMLLLAPLLFLRKRLKLPWGIWLLGVGEWLLPVMSHSLISIARYQAGNLYFALAIPALVQPRPMMRGVVWMFFGMVLAWYASTFLVGNWAS